MNVHDEQHVQHVVSKDLLPALDVYRHSQEGLIALGTDDPVDAVPPAEAAVA